MNYLCSYLLYYYCFSLFLIIRSIVKWFVFYFKRDARFPLILPFSVVLKGEICFFFFFCCLGDILIYFIYIINKFTTNPKNVSMEGLAGLFTDSASSGKLANFSLTDFGTNL